MDSNLLKYYFENKLYIQDIPMNMRDFIRFCKKRDINITKSFLEDLEKKGLFYPIFRIKLNYENLEGFYPPGSYIVPFLEFSYNQNNVFLPQEKEFVPFSEYYNKEIDEYTVHSYYSSYQIYLLDNILNKEYSKQSLEVYNNIIDLLIAIQIYSPYGRSNMRIITIKDSESNWRDHLNNFDLNEVFDLLNVDEKFIFESYMKICSNLKKLLGSNDAIQLWKYIDWKEKDRCIGKTRLGIEYLQWAKMLKRCIEDFIGREIYDVDEINNISLDRIINDIPSQQRDYTLRGIRNRNFYNGINGTYEFNLNRKKLFYLANDLTLDYHPRMILFVEGKTEEKFIPKFFNQFYGNFEDFGFEIINIGGISAFFSSKISDKQNDGKYMKLLVSNFTNLINFNLNVWQAIPFFVGDNENNIISKLQEGKIFNLNDIFYLIHGFSVNEYKFIFKYFFEDLILFLNEFEGSNNFKSEIIMEYLDNYLNESKNLNSSFIDEWTWIWKLDFELDNYSPEELKRAIDEVCDKNIPLNEIQRVYKSEDAEKIGIKSLGEDIEEMKIEINEKLFENLVENYNQTNNKLIFKRPIFELLTQVYNFKRRYNTPKNTQQLLSNKKRIYSEILYNNK